MIDQIRSRTIPIQSWGMVLAALITTVGIVFAACINSGWIEKPSSATVIALPSSRQTTECQSAAKCATRRRLRPVGMMGE